MLCFHGNCYIGRLDRKIEFPVPDRRQKRLIFQVQLGFFFEWLLDTFTNLLSCSTIAIFFSTIAIFFSTIAIFSQVATSKMNLNEEIDLEDYVARPEKLSAAEITAICQEV